MTSEGKVFQHINVSLIKSESKSGEVVTLWAGEGESRLQRNGTMTGDSG